jgi:hypothetical protein
MRTVGLIGLALGLALSGCQRQSYTEEDAQRAIAERQRRDTEWKLNARRTRCSTCRGGEPCPLRARISRVRPPLPAAEARSNCHRRTATSLPRPLPAVIVPAQQSPPPNVGDVKLDPQTGQYGIQPPGAPDTYTIPLDRQQGQ